VGADRRIRRLRPRLGVALGVPDRIFATFIQYAFLSAITAVTAAATAGAAVLPRRSP